MERLAVGCAGIYFVDAEITTLLRQFGAEQTHLEALRSDVVATVDVGVATSEFANHSADNIGQIDAIFHIRQQHGIFVVYGFPVNAVHIFEIEAIAESAPCLVVDLRPFLSIIDVAHHIVEVHRVRQVGFALGEVGDIYFAALIDNYLFHTRHNAHIGVGGNVFVLLFSEVVGMHATVAIVVERFAIACEAIVATCAKRHAHYAVGDALNVHLYGHRLCFIGLSIGIFAFFLVGFRLGSIGFLRFGAVTIAFEERRRRVGSQSGEIDAIHLRVGEIPFHRAVDRVEIARRGEEQIFAVGAESRLR